LDEGLANAAAAKDANAHGDAERVRAIVADSRLVQMLDGLFGAPAIAWRHSRVRAIVMRALESVAALELSQRVRLLGWMIIVAVTTRGVLYVLAGNSVTTLTLAVWGLLLGVGAFMMAACHSVAAAWVEWRNRRT
jgi:hypothetical protein